MAIIMKRFLGVSIIIILHQLTVVVDDGYCCRVGDQFSVEFLCVEQSKECLVSLENTVIDKLNDLAELRGTAGFKVQLSWK